MKRKRDFTYEVPLLMTKERGGRESRDRYDGDVTDGIVGNGEREGEKERERKNKRGFERDSVFSSHNRLCGLRRLPDEAQDRESMTFQTQ